MLWRIIKEAMLRHPGRTLSEGDATLTYEDAVVLAENLALRLHAPCYAILCRSELLTGIAVLACLAAEATAVPLSFRYGEAHLRRITEAINLPYVITDRGGRLAVAATDAGEYAEPVHRPAVILFTSGTTGKPKGVMLSERNLMSNVRDIASYFAVGECDRLLIARPLYHCAVLTGEFLLALYKGMDIHFCPDAFSPVEIGRHIRAHATTVLCGTPTLLSLLGSCLRSGDALDTLRTLAVSGECLTPAAAQRLVQLFPGREIYHVYGLTEASPRVAYLPPSQFERAGHLLGSPLASVRLMIVDGQGQAVSDEEEGELLVSGPNVMMGYYQAPDRTREAFYEGWLRTGDIACRGRDGLYRICGRRDDMIIRAGMNIYPAEIEGGLKADPRVREVLAYGYRGAGDTMQIGLKIAGAFADKAEIKRLCRDRLPDYEQPTRIELLEELPRNGSGKIIRKA